MRKRKSKGSVKMQLKRHLPEHKSEKPPVEETDGFCYSVLNCFVGKGQLCFCFEQVAVDNDFEVTVLYLAKLLCNGKA